MSFTQQVDFVTMSIGFRGGRHRAVGRVVHCATDLTGHSAAGDLKSR
jgi:hypothetical protein